MLAMTIDLLKSETLKLGRIERIEFVQFILDSLAQEEKDRSSILQLSDEQKEIVQGRVEAIKNGQVETKSYQEVEEKIKKKYGFDA